MFDDTLIPSLTFNTFYISVDLLCKCCNDKLFSIFSMLLMCEHVTRHKLYYELITNK